MGWHMKFVIYVQLAYVSVCLTREMSVVREWTTLDVQLPPGDGQESRRSIVPSADVKSWFMYKDRVFVNLRGQPYSLAYLNLTDNSTSPLLRPYPSYENQLMINKLDKVRVDRCDRLWMISVSSDSDRYMIVFDLKTDSVLRNSSIPERYYSYEMTVDDFDCDNEYLYISSLTGVWTYSWAEGDSWHHISERITSMRLAPNSIVYYNVGFDFESMVFYMSTTHLRDKSNYKTIDIREHGRSRKLNVDLAASALDAKNDVLYYFTYDNRTVIHAVPCWTSERCSSNCQDVSIDPTYKLDYIAVDENGYLWAITWRSSFMDGKINFRLLSVPVRSTCVESNANDTTNTSTDVEPNAKDTTNTSTGVESNAKDTTNTSTDVEPNAKDTTNTTNINESTTAASSTTEQTSTLGSVPKHTTVYIADTTAATPNSNVITQAVGGTNMPYLLFSFANVTLNLSNVTITNFPINHFN